MVAFIAPVVIHMMCSMDQAATTQKQKIGKIKRRCFRTRTTTTTKTIIAQITRTSTSSTATSSE